MTATKTNTLLTPGVKLPNQLPTRGRPTASQSAQIVDRILGAAWEVLLELGPEHLTIDRVAPVAQASKQTIYARFPGKLPLLQAVLAARLDMIFADMREQPVARDPDLAFADQARRSVQTLISPEARLLDRLVDWIDATLPGVTGSPTRAGVYEQSLQLIQQQLLSAITRWNLAIHDIPAAAGFWLDGLFGHTRGLQSHELQHEGWPLSYARFFLRAVCH